VLVTTTWAIVMLIIVLQLCGNATSQPNANNISGSAVVNVTSDVFANSSPINELTLPNFYGSSKQVVLHFLRDLDEYYRINNVPEPETIGDKFMKIYARMRKKAKDRREQRKMGNKTWGPKVKEKVLVRAQPTSDAAVGVTAKFIKPYEGPYIISRVIPPSTYELSTTSGDVRGEFNKKSLKPYLDESSNAVGSSYSYEICVVYKI